MLQSRADPERTDSWEKTGSCRAEQFLDKIDSWKTQDAAEQSSSWIEYIPGVYRMLESRACREAEQFPDRIYSRSIQDAVEQSMSWSRAICGRKRFR